MAKYKIVKPVNFGNGSIGDKNYGPQCPSCWVPVNTYAPKVGDTIEGIIETVNINNGYGQMVPMTGIVYRIRTNGAASTQFQSSDQLIPQDYLALEIEPQAPVEPSTSNPTSPGSSENTTPSKNNVGETICWICENRVPVIIGFFLLVLLVILLNQE